MRPEDEKSSCDSPGCGCGPKPVSIGRRDFLAVTGLGAAGMLIPDLPAVAGPFEGKDFEALVPSDKKLSPDWIRGLTERGQPEAYRGNELNWVGMPVGGIACGQLYLGGDGRLWYWDIFTSTTTTDYEAKIWAGPHYEHPLNPKPVVDQGFAIRVKHGEKTIVRALDRRGFKDITFRGEYPIGRVSYRDEALPLEVNLEAFSPFIPLNVEDSSLPATILSFQIKNTSQDPLEVTLAGWLENAVCRNGDGGLSLSRRNAVVRRGPERASLFSTVEPVANESPARGEIVFGDFEGSDYGGWTAQGKAFEDRPYHEDEKRFYTTLSGYEGHGFVNTHVMHHGEDPAAADLYTGTLTSPEFTIERRFIHFRIGGGAELGKLGLRLIVDGKELRRAAGRNVGPMRKDAFDVRDLQGKKARLQIVNQATGGWGHTTVDQIVFSDRPIYQQPSDVPGYGSMALTLVEGPRGETLMAADLNASGAVEPATIFDRLRHPESSVLRPMDQPLKGAIGRMVTLNPGETTTFRFVLSWWFPFYGQKTGEMAAITDSQKLKRHYIRRFEQRRGRGRLRRRSFRPPGRPDATLEPDLV